MPYSFKNNIVMENNSTNKRDNNKEFIMHLTDLKNRGIIRLFFSRFALIVLLLLLQILLFISLFIWLEKYLPYFTLLQAIFVLSISIYLFNSDMDSSAKLTWLAVIAVMPFIGTIFLIFTKSNIGHRKTTKRALELINQSKNLISQDEKPLKQLQNSSSSVVHLNQYVCNSGNFPIFDNTTVKYFSSGEEKFASIIEELETAQNFIFMEYFIIEEGYMWGRILDILSRKAKEGVDVRVMYDGMCELALLPHDYPLRLQQLGIKAKMFAPLTPFVSTHYNYRDHRKILVIDGSVAFNGGVNLADEYINKKNKYGHWKDAAVMLKGKAVKSFTLMFLQMWNLMEEEPNFEQKFLQSPDIQNSQGFVMPFADCPLDKDKVGENVYMDILYRAKRYVHIMTPYLILDGELETALKYAAQRGIDIKIILPGIPDKKSAYALAKSHYKSLTEAGIKIYEYTPGFVHSKVFVSDSFRAVVGTINLDYRSLYHHFECATYLYKTPCIKDIEEDFENTLKKCKPVTAESIKNEKLFYKILGKILKLVAPLM